MCSRSSGDSEDSRLTNLGLLCVPFVSCCPLVGWTDVVLDFRFLCSIRRYLFPRNYYKFTVNRYKSGNRRRLAKAHSPANTNSRPSLMQSDTSALIGLGVGLGITVPIVIVLSVLTYIRCRKYHKIRRRRNDGTLEGGEEQYKQPEQQHTTAKSPLEVLNSPSAICRNKVPMELSAGSPTGTQPWFPEAPKPIFEVEPRRRSDFSFGPSSAGEIELHRNWNGANHERGRNRFIGFRSNNNTLAPP